MLVGPAAACSESAALKHGTKQVFDIDQLTTLNYQPPSPKPSANSIRLSQSLWHYLAFSNAAAMAVELNGCALEDRPWTFV